MRLSSLGKFLLICIFLGLSTPSLAANYIVSNTSNSDPGSLREAISLANVNSSNDTITFTVNGTINLDTTLTVNKANGTLTIIGNGVTNTILSGQNTVRVLLVNSGVNLTLEGLTITQGKTTSGDGGGIFNNGGTLTVNNSTFSANSTTSGNGGGIFNSAGTLTVSNSTFSANSATSGGGIRNLNGSVTVTNSIFDNNSAEFGGGFLNYGSATITNSVISNNSASNQGGGVWSNQNLALRNATISGNAAVSGGGIYNLGSLNINNSIVANSTNGGNCVRGGDTINARYSLIEGGLGCVNGTNIGNLTGDPALNPDLTLSVSSPAINAGDNTLTPVNITTDLAGNARIQNITVDMGAFESLYAPLVTISATDNAGAEAGADSMTFQITRNTALATPLTVNYTLTGTADASDYTPTLTGSVTILANASTVELVVTPVDDATIESAETLTLTLVDDTSYDLGSPNSATATIADNDSASITVTPTSGLTTTEAGATASFTVVLNSQPTADVVIALSSNDTSEGTVSPASLTFTSANWSTPQTVTVTGVDDAVIDGAIGYSIVLTAATSGDASYNGFDPADVSVTNTDNDTAGITVTPTSGLTTAEAGATATFTVVLTSQPTADVLINLSSSDTTEGTVSPASLTFTSANWNTPQTVTVTGVDDAMIDGAIGYSIVLAAATSSDASYNGVNPTDVSVSNTDNDTAGITVTPTSGLTTSEAGATATFTVKLNSQPTANVSIALSSNDTSEGTVNPASLTFTSANWNNPQTVTVTGVDDALVDGAIGYTIVLAAATSGDASYNGFDPTDVSVTNTDNDTAGVTVTPTSGLTTTEAGATATFTVVLTSQPTADVLIALSSSNTGEGTVSPASLTFTNANWNTAQTVTVTGVDDALVDGNVGYTIVLAAATSSDAHYSGFDPTDVSVTNTDNDTAGISVTPTSGLTTTEAGATATFTVKLNSQPTANVSIALSSSNTGEGTVSPASLTFTNANWNSAQTVTVTGVDDALVDGNVGYTIVLAAATSGDASYNGFDPADVSVTNTDNDTAGITVTPTSGLTTSEAGGTTSFTVVLNSQPTADVVIALSSNDTSEGTVSPASLTFTNANWNSAQTVTVTGVDDALVDGTIGYSVVLAAATSSDAHYSGFDPADVSVTNTDNDTAGVTVTPTSGLTTSEAGGTTSFTVVLNSQPTADVVIALSSNDTSEGTVSPASLTFTNANWNSAQTVTVTGVDDALVDGTVGYTIVLTAATSGDASYNGFDPADVSVSNTDNDTAGITVTPTSGLTTTEAGATATFTVVLTSQPTTDVLINLSSSDTTEGTVSPANLTFTSANWSTPQTVTVTGVDDALVDGAIGYSIALTVDPNSDATYVALTPSPVSVTNSDNDSATGIPTLSEWALLLLATLMLGIGARTVTQRRI